MEFSLFAKVHRDLHSGDILQLEKYRVNICDLGLCQPTNHEATTTVIPCIPPEVLRGEKFRMAGDIYSFALLLWELATRKPPFHDHLRLLSLIPPSIAEIIVKCWDVNNENRPTANELRLKFEGSSTDSEYIGLEKYVEGILKNGSTITTTTPTRIHPGAVYTSRVLSLQIIEETRG
ncbi:hypothetical protein G9A89_004048 [Geosiphon pyriformis]|nr:hypothetical protein G9A89_004048 [Geosiphon pyriformis]